MTPHPKHPTLVAQVPQERHRRVIERIRRVASSTLETRRRKAAVLVQRLRS
jgi:hypothetical protein